MATGFRTCKICGKQYEYCMTNRIDMFRWQDVACSPEHGALYFQQIADSRGENVKSNVAEESLVEDEYDPLFEEEFEDGDEDIDIE